MPNGKPPPGRTSAQGTLLWRWHTPLHTVYCLSDVLLLLPFLPCSRPPLSAPAHRHAWTYPNRRSSTQQPSETEYRRTSAIRRGARLVAGQLPTAIHCADSEGRHPQNLRASAHVHISDLGALHGQMRDCHRLWCSTQAHRRSRQSKLCWTALSILVADPEAGQGATHRCQCAAARVRVHYFCTP